MRKYILLATILGLAFVAPLPALAQQDINSGNSAKLNDLQPQKGGKYFQETANTSQQGSGNDSNVASPNDLQQMQPNQSLVVIGAEPTITTTDNDDSDSIIKWLLGGSFLLLVLLAPALVYLKEIRSIEITKSSAPPKPKVEAEPTRVNKTADTPTKTKENPKDNDKKSSEKVDDKTTSVKKDTKPSAKATPKKKSKPKRKKKKRNKKKH